MSRFDGRIVKISITVCTEFVLKINKNGTRYRERMPFCGYLLLSSAARIFSAAECLPGEYTFHDSSCPLISERRFSRRFLASAAGFRVAVGEERYNIRHRAVGKAGKCVCVAVSAARV